MANEGKTDEAKPRDFRSLGVPLPMLQRLKVVAAHLDLTMVQVLEKFFGPVLDREYQKAVDSLNRDLGGEG